MSRRAHLFSVRVLISGDGGEQILNLLARSELPFRDPNTEENGLSLYVKPGYRRKLGRICDAEGLSLQEISAGSLTDAGRRLIRRRVLLFGLTPCIFLLWLSSLFVWEISVEGNREISDGRILRELDELGIRLGTCRVGIDQYRIANEMLLRIPELSWLTLNTSGSRLEVCVREEVPMPDIVRTSDPSDLTASKEGIIDHMTVLAGSAAVKRGDLAEVGQVLVSSETPDLLGGVRYEHASGEVWAWTFYEITACTPSEAFYKSYTGAEYCRRVLHFFTGRIKIYFLSGNPYTFCDRITMYNSVHLPGGTVLPFGIGSERCIAYEPERMEIDQAAAERWLETRLHERLAGMIDGRIRSENYISEAKDGVICVTLRAVCLENIAVTAPAAEGSK